MSLPRNESGLLDAAIGQAISTIELIQCQGERFEGVPSDGYVRTTFGLYLAWPRGSLGLIWGDDAIGDPFRVEVCGPRGMDRLKNCESVQVQDVSMRHPWVEYVGAELRGYEVLEYETKYTQGAFASPWRPMPWGILLHFAAGSFLVAAARHEDPIENVICADEIIIAFDPVAVSRLRAQRVGRVVN